MAIVVQGEELVFTPEVHPAVGPLPELRYRIESLWRAPDQTLIQARFEAPDFPRESGELAFYRWEPAPSPQRAMYQYFLAPGYAGLVLKPISLSRLIKQGVPDEVSDELGTGTIISLKELATTPR